MEFRMPDNRVIPGFSFAENGEIFGDAIDLKPNWISRLPLSSGEYFRMALRLSDADLYSFRFV